MLEFQTLVPGSIVKVIPGAAHMVKSGQLMIRALALFVFTFLWLLIASADEWPAAQPIGVSSPSGRIVVHALPGNSIGDVYGFSGAEKGEFATAIYYRLIDPGGYEPYQKVTLQNPVAPVSAFLTDEGILVTLDNWHNVGIDPVIVIYGSDGVLLRMYRLSDLYKQTQIESMPRSVSSIWWRCSGKEPFLRYRTLYVYDVLDGSIEVDTSTGSYEYRNNSHDCEADI